MTERFNFLETPARDRVASILTIIRLDPKLRSALAAITGAILLVLAAWGLEAVRLHGAIEDDVFYTQIRNTKQPNLRHVEQLGVTLLTLRATARQVDTIRRAGLQRENELASIGNQLPHGVWISGIKSEGTAWRIEGRSERIAGVGRAMTSLRSIPDAGPMRLLSVRAPDAKHPDAPVTYELRLEAGQ